MDLINAFYTLQNTSFYISNIFDATSSFSNVLFSFFLPTPENKSYAKHTVFHHEKIISKFSLTVCTICHHKTKNTLLMIGVRKKAHEKTDKLKSAHDKNKIDEPFITAIKSLKISYYNEKSPALLNSVCKNDFCPQKLELP